MTQGGRTIQVGVARSDLAQLVIVAVLIAIGSGVVASALVAVWPQKAMTLLAVGGFICAIGVVFAFWRTLPATTGNLTIDALLVTKIVGNEPISIPRYDISEEISTYYVAAHSENKALGKIWNADKFFTFVDPKEGKGFAYRENDSARLASEAVEYYILSLLSTHLTDYFNSGENIIAERLITLERNDVPDLFTRNRFLDLFSRPMNEREPFEKSGAAVSNGSKVVFAYGEGGALFDDFQLTLPRGMRIKREDARTISLTTKTFSMSINSGISMFMSNLPRHMYKDYLDVGMDEINVNKIDIKISVKFSFLYIISTRGLVYYRWVDDFLNKISQKADFQTYLTEIGWEAAVTSKLLSNRASSGPSRENPIERDKRSTAKKSRPRPQANNA